MALLFGGASTDVVNAGDGVALRNLTTATYIHWVYLNGGTPAFQIFQRKGTYGGAVSARDFYIGNGVTLQCAVARASANLQGVALLSNFAAYGTGKWLYVVGVHDTGGAAGAQKLYIGDLTTRAAEPSAYATQTAGSGALGDNTTQNQFIGNVASGSPILGRLAVTLMFNRVLTLAELHSIQFRPRPLSGCVGYWIFGNTTGTQTDYSGNANAGTVTGATVADHIPQPSAFAFDLSDSQASPRALSGGPTLAQPTVAGTLTEIFTGTAAVVLAGPSVAGTVAEAFTGTAGVVLAGLTVSGTLAQSFAVGGGPTLAQLSVAGTVVETFSLSTGPTLTGPAIAGTFSTFGLDGAVTLGNVTVSGALTETFSLAGGITVQGAVVGGSLINLAELIAGVDMLHSVSDQARYAHAVSDEG